MDFNYELNWYSLYNKLEELDEQLRNQIANSHINSEINALEDYRSGIYKALSLMEIAYNKKA